VQEFGGLNRILPEPAPAERVEEPKRKQEGKRENPFPSSGPGRRKKRKRVPSGGPGQGGSAAGAPPSRVRDRKEEEGLGGRIDLRA